MMVAITAILYVFLFFSLLRGTIFETSIRANSFGSLIYAREIILGVVLGTTLYSIGVHEEFMSFYVTKETVISTVWFVFYALIMWLLVFRFLVALSPSSSILRFRKHVELSTNTFNEIRKAFKAVFWIAIFLFGIMTILGMNHALINYLLGGDLGATRLSNRHETSVPTVVMSFFRFITVLYGILLGWVFFSLNNVQKYAHILLLILISTFFGDKMPVANSVITFFLARLTFGRPLNLSKFVSIAAVVSFLAVSALLILMNYQMKGAENYDIFEYIVLRAGIGQIQGVFEQFALRLTDDRFIFHSIPFANYFVDYPVYNKELMMATWGRNVEMTETGVMNSFFIGEALAIGGINLVLFSPLIVALSLYIHVSILGKAVGLFITDVSVASRGLSLLIPMTVMFTADLSGFLFLKLLIMHVLFILVVFFLTKLL